ncbi:MAG: peptidyl-alpha-hydroxyglycine alpha-amidating lyase family protein [Anaerolineales bacterium]
MRLRKIVLMVVAFTIISLGILWGILKEQATPEPFGEPYYLDDTWPELQRGVAFGQVSGVDVDHEGNVWVLHRADRVWHGETLSLDEISSPVVLVLKAETGEVLQQWGRNTFVMPHSLTIDPQGNVWITDVGLHQVLKLDPSGTLLATFGEAGIPGDDVSHFNMPTDVAFAQDGSFFVSDGYGNHRILHFSAEGIFLNQWGEQGTAPGQFEVPHSLAVDSEGRVYVADRGNRRLQIFTETGEFLAVWENDQLGRPWAVHVSEDGFIYVVDGGDQQEFWPDRARILKLDMNGEIISAFGSHGSGPGQFIWPHTIAVSQEGIIYVGDVRRAMGIQRFWIIAPPEPSPSSTATTGSLSHRPTRLFFASPRG